MNNTELNNLLYYSFRYALGRQTYAVQDVADLLIKHKNRLKNKDKYIQAIKYAIEVGQAGSINIDVPIWNAVAKELADENQLDQKQR